jgi:hypothetical protein
VARVQGGLLEWGVRGVFHWEAMRERTAQRYYPRPSPSTDKAVGGAYHFVDNRQMGNELEPRIDALYALPLGEFVAARQSLAKSLTGEAAKRVKGLTKPTTLPWIVNQIRWHDHSLYDRLMKAGAAFRAAQIAALEGRSARLPEATAAHKSALADAVRAGVAHGRSAKVGVDADALLRMLETVSTADTLAEPHGRFTTVVQPAGFEALLGVAVQAPAARSLIPFPVKGVADGPTKKAAAPSAAEAEAQREAERAERERLEAAARREEAIASAKAVVAAAKAEEARARDLWRKAKDALIDAEHALEDLQERAGQ